MPKTTTKTVTTTCVEFSDEELETLLCNAIGRPDAVVMWDAERFNGCMIEFSSTTTNEPADAAPEPPPPPPRATPRPVPPNMPRTPGRTSLGPEIDLNIST